MVWWAEVSLIGPTFQRGLADLYARACAEPVHLAQGLRFIAPRAEPMLRFARFVHFARFVYFARFTRFATKKHLNKYFLNL